MTFHDTDLAPIAEHRQRENRRSAVLSSRAEQRKLDQRGLGFTRIAITSALAGGDLMTAAAIAENRYPGQLTGFYKAAIGAGTTTHPTWASPLVPAYEQYASEFCEFLRAQTILGAFGTGKTPALRVVPFNISVPRQTTGGKGYWVAEGAAKPLTKFDFDDVTLGWAKVANIAIITEELLRFSNPSAELIVRDQLSAALAQVLDEDFVRPDKAAVPDVSPASITYDVMPVASSGASIEAIRKDVKALFANFVAARMSPKKGVWIMGSMTAIGLSLMSNALGQLEFPDMNLNGGFFYKLPCIVSDHVPEGMVMLVSAEDVFLADEGQATLDVSREASLSMDDASTMNSFTPTGSNLVSLWQTNSVGIRAERYINWAKRRPQAVQYLTGVEWGSEEIFS